MIKALCLVFTFALAVSSALAQDKKLTAADFGGTWNVEMMSHQVALVIEPKDDMTVTATLMMMGTDLPLKGEVSGNTLTLVGVKTPGSTGESAAVGAAGHVAAQGGAKPITVTLQEDGMIAGEMMTQMGPAKFTGEKLKAKKKG
mgnify:FL=1